MMSRPAARSTEASPALSDREFKRIGALCHKHFGLDLREGKQSVVQARLSSQLRVLNLPTVQAFCDHLTSDRTGRALTTLVELLTTHHTGFFREPRHFDLLRKIIYPTLRRRPLIHIWSAACSTGEEPYSIAMSLLEENRSQAEAKVRIRASDISHRVLERGRQGVYAAETLREVPAPLIPRYLLKGRQNASGTYRFKSEVRSMIAFEHLNLVEALAPGYRCSVLFCRNVMIYFDKPTQQDLVRRLCEHLEPGVYFLVGYSESLHSLSHELEFVGPATYRKPVASSCQPVTGL